MTDLGKLGALSGLLGVSLLAGCGGSVDPIETTGSTKQAVSEANVEVTQTESPFPCPSACFLVTADKNLTHIFVNVDDGQQFSITVDDKTLEEQNLKLHDSGGPCNHGEREIDRDVWFPLIKNQEQAKVCVAVQDSTRARISVGAKADGECKEGEEVLIECKKECPPCKKCENKKCDEWGKCDCKCDP
jgi:hypothetical protein